MAMVRVREMLVTVFERGVRVNMRVWLRYRVRVRMLMVRIVILTARVWQRPISSCLSRGIDAN